MEQKATFRYFYGEEADMHSFYRIPKLLFTNDYFKALSNDAKILYGLMLDRMSLSVKNQWFDEENKAYIYFSVEDIMELLNCGKNKAVKIMQELDDETGIGLIEKKRQGFGKANIIYVKNFVIEDIVEEKPLQEFTNQTSGDKVEDTEVYKSNFMKFTNQTSRIPKNKPLEVYFSNPNNNKYNNTYKNNTESNLIPSVTQESEDDTIRCDEMEQYCILAETVKQNIDYDVLLQSYPNEGQLVQGIYELIVETVAYTGKKLVVASNELPAEFVKNRFMKLNFMHIQYVISSMKKNTTEIKNIKKYLLAALYNAPATMQGYYQAEVNHAMPQYAEQGCFMNYPWADLTYCILAITSLILFLIHWSCKKAQINSISLYRTFFQRYSFYIVNRDWLCLETHTVPAKRHCHKSSPSFLSLYLPDPSRTLPDAGCCMRIF